jgi:flagellar hook-basal body complex protein FliE
VRSSDIDQESNGDDMQSEMKVSIAAIQSHIAARAEALGALAEASPIPAVQPALAQEYAASGPPLGFAESLRQAIEGVDAKERAASDKMAEVDSGRSDDLVGAMLASQEASLSFSMLMQARNKVVGAMDDLIKLQL